MNFDELKFEHLLIKVAQTLDISPNRIMEESRLKPLVEARYILFLFLDDKKESPTKIGLRFNKHRSTVLYGLESARDWLRFDAHFKANYNKCKQAINEQA